MADATLNADQTEPTVSGADTLAYTKTTTEFNFGKALQDACRETGRSPLALSIDYAKASLGKTKLSHDQFFRYRVYDKAIPAEDRSAFVGQPVINALNRDINKAMNNTNIVDDKLIYCAALRGLGMNAPVMQAMLWRHDGDTAFRRLGDTAEFAAFLRTGARYPLFCKPNNSSMSQGAASFLRYDAAADRIIDVAGNPVDPDAFAAEAFAEFGAQGYIIQDKIVPHPELQDVSGQTVGTIRIYTLDDGGGPRPVYAVWKIPAYNAVADNLWRTGNLVGEVDLATGEVLAVRRSGIDGQSIVHTHPDSGAQLTGRILPDWEEAKRTVRRAAALTPYTLGIGFDLALSDKGPTIVEGNTFPNHTLYQAATGRGFLSPEIRPAVERAIDHAKATADRLEQNRKKLRNQARLDQKESVSTSLAQGHRTAHGEDADG